MTRVLVRHSFEIWEEWEDKYATKDHIEFYYNDGTSCFDNVIEALNTAPPGPRLDMIPRVCKCWLRGPTVVLDIEKDK